MPIMTDEMIGSVEIYWDSSMIQDQEITLLLSFNEELSWFVNYLVTKGSKQQPQLPSKPKANTPSTFFFGPLKKARDEIIGQLDCA